MTIPISYDAIYARTIEIMAPFNKKGIALSPATTFATDLALDSLTVMDLVATIEDDYDILLPLNMLPDLETIAQLAAAIEKILKDKNNG